MSRCTPGLLLQARVIGAEESWVGIQGQVEGGNSGAGRIRIRTQGRVGFDNPEEHSKSNP
ncbi:MAG: hypothetical protein CL911_04300 [Deltaproteobacteria bacterium]|nr:hypothetical protein [Deltaproteobacteria bacterium]